MSREEFLRFVAQNPVGDSDGTPNYVQDLYEGFEMYLAQKNLASSSGAQQPTTSTPHTEGSASIPRMTVEDLLMAPGRTSLTTLDPERKGRNTWFKYDKGEINKAILKMLRSDLPGAYPSYNHLPSDVKTRWFRAFAQQFNWEPSITETVRAAFEKKVQKSFSNNLCEWKDRWKLNKDPPVSMSNTTWAAYIKMWQDDKVKATADKNSKNRRSERGGHGIAVHNTGSKTYERRKDELTVENGGEEPHMLLLIEDIHRSRKTGEISDKRIKRVVETCKEKIDDQLSQGGSIQSNQLTQAEINAVVQMETPVIKGRRLGFGTLPDPGQEATSSATFSSNSDLEMQLRMANENIATLKKDKAEKDKTIKYLEDLARKVVDKFPDLYSPQDEDEDETQE